MNKANFNYFSAKTNKAVLELTKELDLKDPRVFVRRAVEEKILDLKRAAFFSISDRVAAGLRRQGIVPADFLRRFKS